MSNPRLEKLSKEQLRRELEKLGEAARRLEATAGEPNRERVIHELHIHQVELEMQNREFRAAQVRLEEATARYADLYDFAPVGYCTLDLAGRILEINLTGATLIGAPRETLVGQLFGTAAPLQDKRAFLEHMRRCDRENGRITSELVLVRRAAHEKRVVQIVSDAVHGEHGDTTGYRTILIDITDRKALEDRLRLLSEIGARLASSLDWEAVLETAATAVVPAFADLCVIDIQSPSGAIERPVIRFADSTKQRTLAPRMSAPAQPDGWQPPQTRVIGSGEPMLLSDVSSAERDRLTYDERDSNVFQSTGIRSLMIVPLTARGRTSGALTLATAESGRRYEQAELMFAQEFASRLAVALDNARLHDEVQRANEKAARIVAISSDAIISVDDEQRITMWNDGAEKIYGYTAAEAIGASLDTLVPPRLRAAHHERVQAFVAGEQIARRLGLHGEQIAGLRKNGDEFPADASISKLEMGGQVVLTVAVRDITEQKRAEETQRQEAVALERLNRVSSLFLRDQPLERVLAEILDAAIAIAGADFGNVQLVDPPSSDLHIAAQSGFPEWWIQFWNTVSKGQGACGTAIERGERVVVEDVTTSPNFDPKQLEAQHKAGVRAVQSTPLLSRAGEPLGMISTHYRSPHRPPERVLRLLDLLARQAADMLERFKTETALHLSEAKSSGILSVSADAIISIDEAQHITLWNDGAEKIYGYTRAEATGKLIEMLAPKRLRATYREYLDRFAVGPDVALRWNSSNDPLIGLRKNGEEFPADAAISKLQIDGQKILTLAVRDITEQKRLENEQRILAEVGRVLSASLEFDELLENVVAVLVRELADYVVLYLVQPDGVARRVRAGNWDGPDSWYSRLLLGIRADAGPDHAASRIIASKEPIRLEVNDEVLASLAHNHEHLRALQSVGLTWMMGVPLLIGDRCLGALLLESRERAYTPTDVELGAVIGRRCAAFIENASLHRAAHRAIQARDDVLAIVAHDLRNPLSTILMETAILRNQHEFADHGPKQAAEVIARGANRMKSLIRDLLDATRMESEPLALDRIRLDVAKTISEFVESQQSLASSTALDLRLDLPRDLGHVVADRDRLLQVLENLVGNAQKFTPRGGRITVGARSMGDQVVFRVEDTGSGIAAEDLPRLFDRYAPRKRADQRGTGLGLPIVKGIVEAHGGRVWVESAIGRGSTFFFVIPRSAPPGVDRRQSKPTMARKRKTPRS